MTASFRSGAIAALLVIVFVAEARATWYSENIEDGADIILMDLRWPWWPSGTYYANWNSGFNPKPNNISFYAGFVASLPDGPGSLPNPDETLQASFRPGSVWTFWGSDADGAPVRFEDVAPNLFIRNDYGGEGSSGTMGGEVWPFVKCRRWYTMLARVWQPLGGSEPSSAHVGRWIKDHADGRWHLIGIARLPIAATSFTGNSGFIEPLTSEKAVRSLHRRLGYYRKDGRWKKSDTIAIDKTESVVVNTIAEDDHEYAAIEYAQRPDLLPILLEGRPLSGDRKHLFTVKQPDSPALGQPAVTLVRAETNGRQVAVSWEVPGTASPAFSYRIEVFDRPDCRGEVVAVKEERAPTARHALVDAVVPSPTVRLTVRLTVTDIFDQAAPAAIVEAVPLEPPAPAARTPPEATIPGLAYELYLQDSARKVSYFDDPLQRPDEEHRWLTLDEIAQGRLHRRGLARGFDLGLREGRDAGYAMIFRGFLRVPAAGLHVFRVQIDGGYRIRIGEEDVLVWDGQHGTTEKAAIRSLAKGDHPIEVSYLYDRLPADNFRIEWEGPGLPREPIPLEALRVEDGGTYPRPVVKAEARGDGTARVSTSVDGRGHEVNRIALFLGTLQLAESEGAVTSYEGPLPRGANTLWCRTVFDGDRTVDSDPIVLLVTGRPVDPDWTLRNVGDARASAGLWQTGPQSFEFFGNGMHTVTRRIAGDFTATCRIDASNGSRGEPVNPHAWVGLAAFERGDKLNWEWGQHFYIVQTVREGLRASADFTDFGATRISSYELPRDRPWIRIVRRGSVWTAWTSADGEAWELGAYQWKKASSEMDVGLFFSALPQEARAHYSARVSGLSLRPGAAEDSIPPVPPTARNTGGERLSGVVLAPSDARVVVARSTAAGLIRSEDGGRNWTAANGDLAGDDLAVRSVAVHPGDPRILVRAGGRGVGVRSADVRSADGGRSAGVRSAAGGRLWKTVDAGKNWTALSFEGDFDGTGPSALCGEAIAFDLRDPRTIYVGCESKGLWRSTDDGATLKLLGLAGERITAVMVWPWERHYPAPARGRTHLCVTTCPDPWMRLLGRGDPTVATTATASRGYILADDGQSLSVADERDDTGFYNVAFDKAMQSTGEMCYATSHGYQRQVFAGSHQALYPWQKNLEWSRPFTALGATAMGEGKFGRCITQALDPAVSGRLSRSQAWAFEWSWVPIGGTTPAGGMIAAAGDRYGGDEWWFVYTDGLYHSSDGGEHMTKVLEASGALAVSPSPDRPAGREDRDDREDREAEVRWNRFRGPNGQGIAESGGIPHRFGPEENVVWKIAVPPGRSSPIVWDDRLFLTAAEPAERAEHAESVETAEPSERKELITLGVRRADGRILWRRTVQAEEKGNFHPLNDPASSTPAADGRQVYVYFGTYGLICYDRDGREVWQRRIGAPPSQYGAATSPILYRDEVILVLDGDDGSSRLLAVHRNTGATLWERPRPLFKAGWSTPVILHHEDADHLIVLGSRRLTAYDPATGEELWWAGGFPDETVGVPAIGDGLLFAGAAALGGRGDDELDAAATWKTTVEEFDRDRDGRIRRDEMTEGFAFIQRPELPRDNPGYGLPVNDMNVLLGIFDHDKDGTIREEEWLGTMAGFAAMSQPILAAIRPGAKGDAPRGDARKSHLAWEIHRGIPETPSLLHFQGRLYLLRDGGILTCLKAATGELLFQARVGAPGQYTASPVAAADKVLVASVPGVVTVLEAGDALKVLTRSDFREEISATPAIAGGRIYLRTAAQLYSLGE